MKKRAIKNIGLALFILLVLCLPLKNGFVRNSSVVNSFACNQGDDDIIPPPDDDVDDDDIIVDDDDGDDDDDDDDIIIPGELKFKSPVVEPEAPDREAKEAVTIFEGSYWSGD